MEDFGNALGGDSTALLLARAQFGFVIAFHILFPAFTIGLAGWIALLEGVFLATGRAAFRALSDLWTRLFALSFGMGVVSGVVMSYQFGTNWSRYSDLTGNVIGPLVTYEVATAFFLEATFLGILLFGRGRVPDWLHFLAACMVALGTLLSAFWILAANSWMQTPDGFAVEEGRFVPVDWSRIVFNPSFPIRFVHMVMAAFLTTSFVVASVSAWHLRRPAFAWTARPALAMALGLAGLLVPLQIAAGDLSGLLVREHQPAKLAAIEAHWHTARDVPLILFAWPDQQAERNLLEIAVPHLGSLILTHSWGGEVRGLTEWTRADRPPVWPVFFAFRIMVGLGLLMLALAWTGVWLLARRRLYEAGWYLRLVIWAAPIGFAALLAGWVTTEVGRQPWVVYGLLRTADGVTPHLAVGSVAGSLAAFVLAYAAIFSAGVYFMLKLIRRGPRAEAGPEPMIAAKGGTSWTPS
jgi:cytochrome d ubiquinol oxidase subunit I